MPEQHSPLLPLLTHSLAEAYHRNETTHTYNSQGPLVEVPGMGTTLSSAYEQLRNAAEYTEEHLLLQRAIRRFYHRSLSFLLKKQHVPNLGEELIVELTQAGYLQNSSYGLHVANLLQQHIDWQMQTFWAMRDAHVGREKATEWVLDELSVTTEEILNPHYQLVAVADAAYQHYMQILQREAYVNDQVNAQQYDICLYIATHQALLKSDMASIRHALITMYQQTPQDLAAYIQFNQQVRALYLAPLTEKLQRTINRHGAPLRVLKSLADSNRHLAVLLHDQTGFMDAYRQQVSKEYKELKKRLSKGIVKSIAFIFITKMVIGLGVEVPYDLIFYGSVAALPLAINLLVPPLYMASLKLGLRTPSRANADALSEYIERILYTNDSVQSYLATSVKQISGAAKIAYGVLFLIPFAITVYILTLLGFNAMQGVIFFVFLSTASFLGFRLARMIRELELITKQRGLISAIRDFFYLPFILVGQWISRNYAKVNAVAFVLDMAIELPMKTMMRLFRQWTRFLNEKHDQLY